jgi:hypothetical protein
MRLNQPIKQEPAPEKTFTKKQILGLFSSCVLTGYQEKKLNDQDLITLDVFLLFFDKVLDLANDLEDLSKN